jgi:hypothetical protein
MITILLTSFIAIKPVVSAGKAKDVKYLRLFDAHSISGGVESFECNEFVWEALKAYTIGQMEEKFGNILTCNHESVINMYNPDVIDTIYSFSDDNNEIQFYKARENSFVLTFTVTDTLFKLNGNIHPGMTKDDFALVFNISKPLENTVIIQDSDDTITFQFFFENNRLMQITSDIYLD